MLWVKRDYANGVIAWVLSKVNALATRPCFVQQFFMVTAEPQLALIPAHDAPIIAAFTASGLLQPQFVIDEP
ncbi:MAG: hypothetical protein WEF50_09175 [Myxococcota bacterium]